MVEVSGPGIRPHGTHAPVWYIYIIYHTPAPESTPVRNYFAAELFKNARWIVFVRFFPSSALYSISSDMRGDSGVKGASAIMTLNARVQMSPEALQKTVEKILPETAASFGVSASIVNLKCLMPGRPNPTYRYQTVI